MTTDIKIVADIGGTFARFGISEDGGWPQRIRKYTTADFSSLEEVLAIYRHDEDLQEDPEVLLAMAGGRGPDGYWIFSHDNQWRIDPDFTGGRTILNDFEAAAWGLCDRVCFQKDKDLEVFKEERKTGRDERYCLTGPGTGTGFATVKTVIAGDEPGFTGYWDVQMTHGAQQKIAPHGKPQAKIIDHVAQRLDRELVYEDLISGRGLYRIFHAVSKSKLSIDDDGAKSEMYKILADPRSILKPKLQIALQAFHEFFAQFLQDAVIFNQGYAGVYLTGGVTDTLASTNRLDFRLIEERFTDHPVPLVRQDLERTGFAWVKYPYLALNGLIVEHSDHRVPDLSCT